MPNILKLLKEWALEWLDSFAESEPKEQMGMMADTALVTAPLLLVFSFKEEFPTAAITVFSTLIFFIIVSFVYMFIKCKKKETVSKWFKVFPLVLLIYASVYAILLFFI